MDKETWDHSTRKFIASICALNRIAISSYNISYQVLEQNRPILAKI